MKTLPLASAGFVFLTAAFCAQSQDAARPAFDVASVKQNKNGGQGRLRYGASGVDLASVPISWIIGEAYSIPYARISSADPHIADTFFAPKGAMYFYDIAAKAERDVARDQIKLMLQTLLADRFKLTMHLESKVEPVYKLIVGKNGPKLQESVGEGDPSVAMGPDGFVFRNTEMPRFGGILSGFIGRPVVDQTGLKGFYDFSLKVEGAAGPTDKVALSDWFASSIFADIQKQLGLRLQADKAPVDYLVVDHLEQPSGN